MKWLFVLGLAWSSTALAVGHIDAFELEDGPVDPCAQEPQDPTGTTSTDAVGCAFQKAFDYKPAPKSSVEPQTKRERKARERALRRTLRRENRSR